MLAFDAFFVIWLDDVIPLFHGCSDFDVVVVDVGSANLLRYVSVPICVFIRLCISLFFSVYYIMVICDYDVTLVR